MTLPVLIVDDSPIMRAMLKKALDASGHPPELVLEASDGVEALERLSSERVSVVFADLNMPRMSGVELLAALAREPRYSGLPVVVISSDAGSRRARELEQFGVRAVLRKPFRPEQIRAVLRMLADEVTP